MTVVFQLDYLHGAVAPRLQSLLQVLKLLCLGDGYIAELLLAAGAVESDTQRLAVIGGHKRKYGRHVVQANVHRERIRTSVGTAAGIADLGKVLACGVRGQLKADAVVALLPSGAENEVYGTPVAAAAGG